MIENNNQGIQIDKRSSKIISDHSENERHNGSNMSDQESEPLNKQLIDSKVKQKRKTKKSEFSNNSDKRVKNKAFEQEINDEKLLKKPPRRTRKIRKNDELEEPSLLEPSDQNIFAIIIHQTDKLRTDINIYNPFLRIHILDLDINGQYVKKMIRDRNTLFFYEKENRKLDYISPISTSPFEFKKNRTNIPRWEELIVFNEDFSYFTKEKPNVLLMFELIDLRKSNCSMENFQTHTSQETSQNFQRIAWAFLKIRSKNSNLNIEKKLRLQLFFSPTKYKFNTIESMVPEVYELYKFGPKVKYPASLYVTVKSIVKPKNFVPGVGSSDFLYADLLNGNISASDLNINDRKKNSKTDNRRENENLELDKTTKQVVWSRIIGLPCRAPNDLHLKLRTSKKGCYSVKFSKTGNFLACACIDDDSNYPILIYVITDGEFYSKFDGHFGLVYEISWSKSDNYLVTASNDATARIFDIQSKSKEAFKILPHPNFLYTAKFVPNSLDLIITGGYDKVLRIWSIGNHAKKHQKYGELLQELYGHNGYINSTCFSNKADIFYSADSLGEIKAWNTSLETNKEWNFKEDIAVEEIKNQVINFIQLLPNQFRMLVQMKDNQLNIIDIRIKSTVQHFEGLFNLNQNLRSCISPCGTFLFNSGSDTNIYCWNINTGDKIDTITLNYAKPTRDMDFHPYDNYIVFCCSDLNAPVLIYKHNSEKILNPIESEAIGTTKKKRDEVIDENELDTKLKNDIKNLRDAQSSIWTMVNNKLDSVYPSGSSKMGNEIWSKNNFKGSFTMTMIDNCKKPEFKYRGPKEVEDRVICLYDYKAQRGDELDLKIGDEILVLVRENENWWLGKLADTNQEGYFPAAYVQEKLVIETSKKTIAKKIQSPIYSGKYKNHDINKAIEPIPFGVISDKSDTVSISFNKKSLISQHKSKNASKDLHPLTENEQEVYSINELPTKEEVNSRNLSHKRRPFSHVISGIDYK